MSASFFLTVSKGLLLGTPLLLGFYLYVTEKPLQPLESTLVAKTSALITSSWSVYEKKTDRLLQEWQPISAKLIFQYTDKNQIEHLVVSQKRSGKKHKNFLLEFPGGKIDPHESVIDGLKREIQEEDPSGILLYNFNQQLKQPLSNVHYLRLRLANQQRHVLFKTTINVENWKQLAKFYKRHNIKNKETFGFYLIEKKYLIKPFYQKKQWTPKSHQLLKAMTKSK